VAYVNKFNALVASEGYDMVITTSGLASRNARRLVNGLDKMLKAPVGFLSTPSVQHLSILLARGCPHTYIDYFISRLYNVSTSSCAHLTNASLPSGAIPGGGYGNAH